LGLPRPNPREGMGAVSASCRRLGWFAAIYLMSIGAFATLTWIAHGVLQLIR
jgi:hypothetical protein